MLPVPIVLSAAQLWHQAALAQTHADGENAKAQAAHDEKMARMELDAQIATLRLEVEREQTQARKEILEKFIEASMHVFDRKMDFFVETFSFFKQLVSQHQTSLLEERRRLTDEILGDDIPDGKMVRLLSRKREIGVELADLKKMIAVVTADTSEIVMKLQPNLPDAQQHLIQ